MALPERETIYYTEAEYLAFDLADDRPNEYNRDRTVTRREGRNLSHLRISGNVSTSINNQLYDVEAFIFSSLMRVKIEATTTYRYPDIGVVYGEAEVVDTEPESLLNPTVLIEILSDFTELLDRSDKLNEYLKIPSLQEYILISQDKPQVERYLRQDNFNWLNTIFEGVNQKIELPSIGCVLQFSDIYRRISFEVEE